LWNGLSVWTRSRVLLLFLCAVAVAGACRPAAAAGEYAAIDAHALAAPASAERSVSTLAAYLARPARSDREKARAIYRWITEHINYDLRLFGQSADAQTTLARRRAVCAGYAGLFAALAKEAGLEAVVVRGNSKGVNYEIGHTTTVPSNHAWNAVKIDGRWQLVDCTWGTGAFEGSGFVRRFTGHYFLTPPDTFADDHFPDDPKWQLLGRPLSPTDYLSRAQRRPAFFANGLELQSAKTASIEAGDSMQVNLGAPRQAVVMASLSRRGRALDDRYLFTQREGDGVAIRVVFPDKGDYVLSVFAGPKSAAHTSLDLALEYAVTARGGRDDVSFPQALGDFAVHECQLRGPRARQLPAGKSVEFDVVVPGADDVIVGTGGAAQHLTARGGGRFAGYAKLTRGDVLVLARFSRGDQYQGLLRYTAR
jgi:hypothetical protein